MGNKILEFLKVIEQWNTQDIQSIVSLLEEYLQTERKDH